MMKRFLLFKIFYHLWEIFGQEEAGINCWNDFKHYELESHSRPCWAVCLAQSVVSWNNNINDIKILAPQCTLRLTKVSDVYLNYWFPSQHRVSQLLSGRENSWYKVNLFFMTVITNYHNLSGLNNPDLLLQSCRWEVWQGFKIKVEGGLWYFLEDLRANLFPWLFRGCPVSLVHGPVLHLQSQQHCPSLIIHLWSYLWLQSGKFLHF